MGNVFLVTKRKEEAEPNGAPALKASPWTWLGSGPCTVGPNAPWPSPAGGQEAHTTSRKALQDRQAAGSSTRAPGSVSDNTASATGFSKGSHN